MFHVLISSSESLKGKSTAWCWLRVPCLLGAHLPLLVLQTSKSDWEVLACLGLFLYQMSLIHFFFFFWKERHD